MALQTLPLLIMPPKSVQLCMKNHLNIKKLPLWARDGDWINLCKTVVEQSEILIVLQSQIITVVWAFSQNFGKKKLKKIVWSANSHDIAKTVDFPWKETTYLISFGCFVGLSNVSFSSCQRNLIKTFQIDSMIALITEMDLIFSWDLLNGQK